MVQIVMIMAGYSLLYVAKGVLAGGRRFADVGWVLIIETVVRLAAGIVAIQLAATSQSLGWAMVLGGFAVLGMGWWRRDVGDERSPVAPAPRFLAGYAGGSASSQMLLAGAPIAVGILGADPELVSITFVTFTLFRAPLTLILNLQGRILPYLVGLSHARNLQQLSRDRSERRSRRRSTRRFSGRLLEGWSAPTLSAFSSAMSSDPGTTVAMFAAGGVMAAAAAQVAGQVLVAEARTRRLAMAWTGGLLVAVLAVVVLGGDPDVRVAASFAVGEGTALLLMAILAGRR